jgi:hypothetical protein
MGKKRGNLSKKTPIVGYVVWVMDREVNEAAESIQDSVAVSRLMNGDKGTLGGRVQ